MLFLSHVLTNCPRKMNRFLIWPPLESNEYNGTDSAAAYFTWFFGDVADEIILPVVSESYSNNRQSYSIGCIANLRKIRIVRSWTESIVASISHIIMRTKTPPSLPYGLRCTKMLGSMAVEVPQGTANDPCYYYIGSPEEEPQDAYLCVLFTYWFYGGRDEEFLAQSRRILSSIKTNMPIGQPVTVFGTGPSITEADPKNHFRDGSIICNTIVKNKSFCNSLDILAIVASDCHFHFSCSQYSFQFLSDLQAIIRSNSAIYITFDKFAPFVLSKAPHLAGRTCGIPTGRKEFGFNLDDDFSIYPGESVVNMFLLPVACYLSDSVRLCGFTGRAPNDNYFWSHASDFQYDCLLHTVRSTHPAFFKDRDYIRYSNIVGEQLTSRASIARKNGVRVRSMTTSFYKGLEYQGDIPEMIS